MSEIFHFENSEKIPRDSSTSEKKKQIVFYNKILFGSKFEWNNSICCKLAKTQN